MNVLEVNTYNSLTQLQAIEIFWPRHFNPYHAEFLKWNNPSYISGQPIIIFRNIKMKT